MFSSDQCIILTEEVGRARESNPKYLQTVCAGNLSDRPPRNGPRTGGVLVLPSVCKTRYLKLQREREREGERERERERDRGSRMVFGSGSQQFGPLLIASKYS